MWQVWLLTVDCQTYDGYDGGDAQHLKKAPRLPSKASEPALLAAVKPGYVQTLQANLAEAVQKGNWT
jgi:hypothetical protein